MRRWVLIWSMIVAAAAPAAADPATDSHEVDRPSRTKRRVIHAGITAAGGATYLAVQYGFKTRIPSGMTTWTAPPSFDTSIRNALVWSDPHVADHLADATGYYAAPILALGSLALAGKSHGLGRVVDDSLPVLESAVGVSLLHHVVKFAVARERPAHHFGGIEVEPADDQQFSFYSGHTSLAFSLAVSAGMVAHLRGYRAEPYIWAGGLALATATGYFRIAADAHYASDVMTGALLGTAAGLATPLLLHRNVLGEKLAIVPAGPAGPGASVVAQF